MHALLLLIVVFSDMSGAVQSTGRIYVVPGGAYSFVPASNFCTASKNFSLIRWSPCKDKNAVMLMVCGLFISPVSCVLVFNRSPCIMDFCTSQALEKISKVEQPHGKMVSSVKQHLTEKQQMLLLLATCSNFESKS